MARYFAFLETIAGRNYRNHNNNITIHIFDMVDNRRGMDIPT
jgi:hypothetical protein|tara:strand:- start:866 stop:991 length:126 start_codon:yes stop_codon:yes gene_type:complete